jgi:hypothetical protein
MQNLQTVLNIRKRNYAIEDRNDHTSKKRKL